MCICIYRLKKPPVSFGLQDAGSLPPQLLQSLSDHRLLLALILLNPQRFQRGEYRCPHQNFPPSSALLIPAAGSA